MAADMAGARHIYHNVRAYIKVQRKQVSEAAGKELTRTLVLKSEAHFEAGNSSIARMITRKHKQGLDQSFARFRSEPLEKDHLFSMYPPPAFHSATSPRPAIGEAQRARAACAF